jgi:uncharacterized alpha-E superfamily protein
MVRAARYSLGCLVDDSALSTGDRLGSLESMLTHLGFIRDGAPGDLSRERLQKDLLLLVFQEGRTPGVRDLLKRIHVAAFSVRDRLSGDTWRILNRLEPDARQRPGRLPLAQALTTLRTLVLDLGVFSGMAMEHMTRGRGWSFLDIGRRLERGVSIARLMEAVLRNGAGAEVLLEPALEIADSVMTHRHRYFSELRLDNTLEVLIHDSTNPRSLAFQIESLEKHAATLPTGTNPEGVEVLQSRFARLAQELRELEHSAAADPATTAERLLRLADGLGEVSDLLTQVYFSHVTPQVN